MIGIITNGKEAPEYLTIVLYNAKLSMCIMEVGAVQLARVLILIFNKLLYAIN